LCGIPEARLAIAEHGVHHHLHQLGVAIDTGGGGLLHLSRCGGPGRGHRRSQHGGGKQKAGYAAQQGTDHRKFTSKKETASFALEYPGDEAG
jgi:hypothetical protein